MNPRLKQTITLILKITVAAGIIYWLIHNQSLNLRVLLQLAQPRYILIFLALPLMNLCLNHYRWLLLLRAQGMDVTYRSTLPLTFIGLFFNFALPGGVGGDVVKGYYLLQEQPGRKLDATVTVLLDRIMGVFSMLIVAALSLALNPSIVVSSPEMKTLAFMIGLCVVGGSLFCLFIFTPYLDRWGLSYPQNNAFIKKLTRLHATVLGFRDAGWVWAKCVSISWLSHLTAIAFIGFVTHVTSPETLPWHTYFFVVPLGFIAMALPIAPAGVGVGQAAFFFLFKLYTGEESQVGPNAITAFQAAQLCLSLVGAFMFLQRRKASPLKGAVAEPM